MSYTNRTAPDDTAIKREGLNENIDVAKPGRYYPDDYSTLIRINEQNRGLEGEIPKSLASIIEYYDDYKISTWAHEETNRIQQKKIDNEIQEKIYEEELRYDMLNEDYDRRQQLLSDIDETAEAAKSNPDIKVTDAVSEILEQYTDVEGLSPAARRQWQGSLKTIGENALRSARATDFQNAYNQNKYNIQHLINTAQDDVRSGKLSSLESFKINLPELIKFREHMSPAEFEEYVNNMYDSCVLAEALLYKRRFETGDEDGETTTKRIYDLLQSHKSTEFEGTDESGRPYKFTCSLSERTQNALMNVYTDTKNKGDGQADVNIDIDISDWEKRVGWEDFEKNGYSQNITGMSCEDMDNLYSKTVAGIMLSGATDKKKKDAFEKVTNTTAALKCQLMLTELLPQYGASTGQALQKALTTLNADLKNNKDFSDYKLKINLGGKEYVALAPVFDNLSFGSKDLTSRAYWESYKEGLEKLSQFMSNKPASVVMAQLDGDLVSAGTEIVGSMTRANLLSGEGANTSVARSAATVNALNNYFNKWSKYPNLTPVLSDQVIEEMLHNMEDPSLSEQDKFLMTKSIAFNLTDTKGSVKPIKNVLPDFASYTARTGDQKAGKIFTGLIFLQDSPEIKAIATYMQNPATKETFTADYTKGRDNNEILRIDEKGDIYRDLHIDKNAGLYFMNFGNAVKAYVSHTGSNNPGASYKKIMKEAIDPLFVENSVIRGTGLQSRPFIYSPQMKIYNDSGDKFLVGKTMGAATQSLKNTYSHLGLNPQVTIYSDDSAGQFYYAINGQRIRSVIPGQKGYLGAILNTSELAKNADFVGRYNSISFLSNLAAQDSSIRAKMLKSNIPITEADKKKLSKQPLRSQLKRFVDNTSDTRTIEELYGGGEQANRKAQAGYAAIAVTLSDPNTMKSAYEMFAKQNVWRRKGPSLGAIQNLAPNSPLVKSLTFVPNKEILNSLNSGPSLLVDKPIQQYSIGRTIQRNTKNIPKSITGFASDLNYDEIDSILEEQPEKYTDDWYAQQGYTEEEYAEMMAERMELTQDEMSPEAYQEVVDYVTQTSSYAEKVNTADVSIPVTHAAIGNEGYIDAYNNAEQMGFEVSNGFIPGVTLDTYTPEREYDGPTGYASNLDSSIRTTGLCLDGTTTTPPKAGQKDSYTKNDIKDLIDHYSGVFNIPPSLAHAMFIQESGYNTKARSPVGAYGVAQLMPETAKTLGVDINDPAQNLWGGMRFLATQFQSYGNWPLALAAYNAGPHAVNKAKGIPNFKETQNYVKNILSMAGFNSKGEYTVSFNLSGGNIKFIDENTGRLSPKSMNDFAYMLTKSPGYQNKVQVVYTNRKELTENAPENEAFEKYRNMKTSDNKPMFVYKADVDGFNVVLKDGGTFTGFNPNATAALADSVAKTQTSFLPENDRDQIEALINTFADRYKNPMEVLKAFQTNQFGLPNLTPQEYADYGVPADVSGNPELQARVLNLEFQRAIDVLGTDYKAIYALAGGNVIDEQGNVKSWREVKEDREAYRKQWFIKPSEDAKQRTIANACVESYQKYYARLRGEL